MLQTKESKEATATEKKEDEEGEELFLVETLQNRIQASFYSKI